MIGPDDPPAAGAPEAAAALLDRLPAVRLNLPEGSEISIAVPIARHRITAAVLGRADVFQTAYHWGWRYFLLSRGAVLPVAIDVRPGPDAGSWRAGLATGSHLSRQLDLIGRLASDPGRGGALRILDAPGLDWSGVWLAGDRPQLFSLESGRRADAGRLMTRLRRTAAQQRSALETRSSHL